jgi:hypothetical protein
MLHCESEVDWRNGSLDGLWFFGSDLIRSAWWQEFGWILWKVRRRHKFVFGDSGGCKRIYVCSLKNSDSDPNRSAFFSSHGEKFSRSKFCDCSIRIDVHDVCCLLMTAHVLNGLNIVLSRGCRKWVVWGGGHDISVQYFEQFRGKS